MYRKYTQEFIDLVKADEKLEKLLVKSINKAKKQVADRNMNPAQTLDQLYDFLEWAEESSPWNILKYIDQSRPYLLERIDQSLNYFYFLFDQELSELRNSEQYRPSLQYYPAVAKWIARFTKKWGEWLSKPDSWTEEYYKIAILDKKFGLNEDWYESPSNWQSFNDFFSRRLKNKTARPISESDVVSPADSKPQGVWSINKNSNIINSDNEDDDFVDIKSQYFTSVESLIGPNSKYKKDFAGGSLTHTILEVHDYHRYHFPVSGTVKEINYIPGLVSIGGLVIWDNLQKKYVLISKSTNWQSIQTRATVIVETKKFGLVALIPVGMSQISSINFEASVKLGMMAKKGDPLGWFLFGGSDFVIIFQNKFKVNLIPDIDKHILMGEAYATLSKV
ncbi:MAG: phosphatidylserine decarboxylase [Bifidobacteriaceae bacterium]|jgi:phosphatidylserine decarboxylase precursor|nr:phosphatidylserine decarboxylase [Bifidobacteriaceae bacterium]